MKQRFRRIATIGLMAMAFAGAATAPAAAAGGTPPPPPAQEITQQVEVAAGLTCSITARVPYYQSGRVYAQAIGKCSNKTTIKVRVKLRKNGTVVGSSEDTCKNATACHETTSAVNSSGNQKWCTLARLELPRSIPSSPTTWLSVCENSGF
ncbi:hypothetical protein [Actinokineospora iranica]|uniref:Uncharacterized protein n=1 Tax=Actinokineospora iranica TaxID=1271860 RepID=A0A1G6ZCK2_9PSEU|nr:hypothetical protein [Actinokineospora iranica]SDE00358.1 hypothetical protein SAMN05216174_12821 [Actinokineospora iranica]